jgi:hypothetical protein
MLAAIHSDYRNHILAPAIARAKHRYGHRTPFADAHLLWLLCPQGPVRTCARTLTQTTGREALAWPCRRRNGPTGAGMIVARTGAGYFADLRPRISSRGKSRMKGPFRAALRAGRAGRGASKNEFLAAEKQTVISNFWTLTARSVVGKSWKTIDIARLWPGLSRRKFGPRRFRHDFKWLRSGIIRLSIFRTGALT